MSTAGDRIRAYADQTRRHRPRFEFSDVVNDTVELCDVEAGDRCDIVAAYRHAADMADSE